MLVLRRPLRPTKRYRRELFIRSLQALGAASLILALLYFWFPTLIIGRGVFLITAMLVIVVVPGWRVAFVWLGQKVRPRKRLLLVGTGSAAVALARELHERRHELGVDIVGFVDPDPSMIGAPIINPGVVGTVDDIPSIVVKEGVDRVVVSLADARGKLPMDRLLQMRLGGVGFDHLASVYEEYTGKIAVENLRPSWLIFSEGFNKSRLIELAKRASDILAACTGLILGLPVFALVALAVRLTSLGPILYHQRRVGLDGHPFTVHKFRTMHQDAEAVTGPVWAEKDGDARVTPTGGWLRRVRLDELPQLWNVLVGEMSLVGPRPERPEFVAGLTEGIPYYGQRHIVRPASLDGHRCSTRMAPLSRMRCKNCSTTLYYIKNLSFTLDIFIILQTIKTVILSRGA